MPMRLPIDPAHLEMPLNVIIAVVSSLASVAVDGWQFAGSLLAQFPTPDKVTGWQERDIYLCAVIIFASAIVWMARWIAVKLLKSQDENTAALNAVASSLARWDERMDSLVQPAVQRVMDHTWQEPHRPLGSSRKRTQAADNDC